MKQACCFNSCFVYPVYFDVVLLFASDSAEATDQVRMKMKKIETRKKVNRESKKMQDKSKRGVIIGNEGEAMASEAGMNHGASEGIVREIEGGDAGAPVSPRFRVTVSRRLDLSVSDKGE
jgi:hypothetical protein